MKVNDLEKKQKRTFNGIRIVGGLTTANYFVLLTKHNNELKSGSAGKPPSPIIGAVGCLMLTIGFAY